MKERIFMEKSYELNGWEARRSTFQGEWLPTVDIWLNGDGRSGLTINLKDLNNLVEFLQQLQTKIER